MTRAVHRAGFRPLAFASRHLLLRPAALKIAASIVLTLLALGLYSLSRGSYPLPASTLARALLAPQEMGEQLWGGDRLCMDGSSPRKQREALRDKA